MQGTIKCPICGRPYKWYSHTVADQTACPDCVSEAEDRQSQWRIASEPHQRNRKRRMPGSEVHAQQTATDSQKKPNPVGETLPVDEKMEQFNGS